MGEASPRGLAHCDAGALVGALAAPALYVSPRALTVPKVIVDGQAGFPSQNKPLAKLIVPGRPPVFLASPGIIHYRNERLQPESEPSES
jgi:hypothetical protein